MGSSSSREIIPNNLLNRQDFKESSEKKTQAASPVVLPESESKDGVAQTKTRNISDTTENQPRTVNEEVQSVALLQVKSFDDIVAQAEAIYLSRAGKYQTRTVNQKVQADTSSQSESFNDNVAQSLMRNVSEAFEDQSRTKNQKDQTAFLSQYGSVDDDVPKAEIRGVSKTVEDQSITMTRQAAAFLQSDSLDDDVAQSKTKSLPETDENQSKFITTVVQVSSGAMEKNQQKAKPNKNEFQEDEVIIERKVDRKVIKNRNRSSDFSPDTKFDLIMRSKLQEDLYKITCGKNIESLNASNDSLSRYTDCDSSK